MAFSSEALEDLDELLDIMKPPPSSVLQSKSCFLNSLGENFVSRTWAALWLRKSLKLVWTMSVPLLRNVSGVMVSLPAPPRMLGAVWFHRPSI